MSNGNEKPYNPDDETVDTSSGAKANVPKNIVYKGDTGISPIYDEDMYFNGANFFTRFLRFINLLEPGRTVISVSKTFMWVMLGLMIYVAMYHPDNMTAMISAASGAIGTMMNYGWRRYVQYRNELAHLNVKNIDRKGDDYREAPDKRVEVDT